MPLEDPVICEIARSHNRTPAQVCYALCLYHSYYYTVLYMGTSYLYSTVTSNFSGFEVFKGFEGILRTMSVF